MAIDIYRRPSKLNIIFISRYTTTDNNGGEDTSTICDDSTVAGDDASITGDDQSSANGSVINVKANFTHMSAEEWLNSIERKGGKSEEKSISKTQATRERRQKAKSALLSGSSDESMASHKGSKGWFCFIFLCGRSVYCLG